MKSSLFLCLVLAVLPACGEQREATIASIALYTQFQQNPPQAVLEALQDELESLMSPMGMHFDWRSLNAARSNEVAVELAVLTFKGRCDVTGLQPRLTGPGALGWTHVSDGVILPFSEVDCDRIRGFVQRELLTLHPEEREEVFGRALGRVVAHELYHIFANTGRHGSCGVGKGAFTVQELVGDDFEFEAQEFIALRTSKVRAALENTTGTP